MCYFVFDNPALNTFDQTLVRKRKVSTSYHLVEGQQVAVARVDSLLRQHLPAGQQSDFLSVDADGHELQALHSNDSARFRPACLLVESLKANLADIGSSALYRFANTHGFVFTAKAFNTLIFLDWHRDSRAR